MTRSRLAAWCVALASCAASGRAPGTEAKTTVTRQVRSGAADIHFDITGDGPALVLLHPGVGDRRVWRAVTPALAETHRVIAYDRRGFGDTTYEPETYSDVDDLAAVLDAAGVDAAVLVGNSQGGRVAIDFALEHPSRVAALILVAPAVSGAPDPDTLPEHTARLDAAIEAADDAGDVDEVNRLEAHLWLDGPGSAEGRVGGDARALFLDMNRRALTSADPGERRARDPAYPRLRDIAVPTHVIVGELDLAYMMDLGRHIAAEVPGAALTTMPDVAHVPQLEAPAAFIAALRRVLDV